MSDLDRLKEECFELGRKRGLQQAHGIIVRATEKETFRFFSSGRTIQTLTSVGDAISLSADNKSDY